MDYKPRQAFRLTSPLLNESDDAVIRECPTGHVLRNAPHVYRAIAAQNYVESGAVNPFTLSPWAQAAMQVVGSERTRLMELERQRKQADRDRMHSRAALG